MPISSSARQMYGMKKSPQMPKKIAKAVPGVKMFSKRAKRLAEFY